MYFCITAAICGSDSFRACHLLGTYQLDLFCTSSSLIRWSVHARSLFPCQDSPGIKAKYRARISVADPLVALMSANLQTEKTENVNGMKVYYFIQHVPVSAYLVAIAAGALESRTIGPRSRVWSEPEMVEAAANEFIETEDFIKTGEKLLGDYVWGQYDLLVGVLKMTFRIP